MLLVNKTSIYSSFEWQLLKQQGIKHTRHRLKNEKNEKRVMQPQQIPNVKTNKDCGFNSL